MNEFCSEAMITIDLLGCRIYPTLLKPLAIPSGF
jgi:hypothetical protein